LLSWTLGIVAVWTGDSGAVATAKGLSSTGRDLIGCGLGAWWLEASAPGLELRSELAASFTFVEVDAPVIDWTD
jgi:hypothetical protein